VLWLSAGEDDRTVSEAPACTVGVVILIRMGPQLGRARSDASCSAAVKRSLMNENRSS